MPRNATKTIHYMTITKSLEAQNTAVMRLLAAAKDVVVYQNHPANLAIAIDRLKPQIEKCQALMWPEEE